MILKKIEAEGVTHKMAAEKKQVLTVKNIRNVNTENLSLIHISYDILLSFSHHDFGESK